MEGFSRQFSDPIVFPYLQPAKVVDTLWYFNISIEHGP